MKTRSFWRQLISMTRKLTRSQLLLLLARSVSIVFKYCTSFSTAQPYSTDSITTYHYLQYCTSFQLLNYTPVVYLPIITTTHHTITHYSQQLDYTLMTYFTLHYIHIYIYIYTQAVYSIDMHNCVLQTTDPDSSNEVKMAE